MFEFFRRHTRVLQFVLVLLVFPSFVFFGIQGYSRFTGTDAQVLATVGGYKITRNELDNAMRERVERMRRQMPGVDPKLFETPAMRKIALDALVREHVTMAAADNQHLVPSDERLGQLFRSDPEFAQLRNPDGSLKQEAVIALGMSSGTFAERLRDEFARRAVLQGVGGSVIAPAAAASAALDALFQQREVQVQRFETKDYLAKVAPTDAEIEAYFKAHSAQYRAPEEAAIEYVILDPKVLQKGITVSEEDLRKYYAENEKRYTVPEERQVSHILVKADKDAPKAERDKARAKAETLLAQVRKNPADFAEIAKKNSDDEDSAAKGGRLEFFGRGSLLDLKPFEDAAFALKPGQISDVVATDFGFHIIHLDAVRGGEKKTFEAVRPELETEIRNQLAQKRFADAAVEFADTVYEQSESLKPAADKWKLDIRKAEHVTPQPAPAASGPLANPKFLEAIFSSDATRDKRNTKAIDLGANELVAGRVVRYAPAADRPLAEVKEQIRSVLAGRQAAALARKTGEARLAALRAAPSTALAGEPEAVSRASPRDVPRPLLDAILRAPASPLPAFVGVDLGDPGYAIAKVLKITGTDPAAGTAEQLRGQYTQLLAEAETRAYYEALKKRYKVVLTGAIDAPADPAADAGASAPPR
ncbi:MAG: SurA N-terminal domain-containing protein [Caldimonas sp.]